MFGASESGTSSNPDKVKRRSYPGLLITGVLLLIATASLAARLIWEETALTIHDGPQMIGFSLAHGYFAPLLLAPLLLALWLVVALVVMVFALRRKQRLHPTFWSTLAAAVAVLAVLSLPATFWQWLLVRRFANSDHAADLLVTAAGEGNTRTMVRYLRHGVPVESRNYEGSTAAFAAAAAGNISELEQLTSMHADLSAVNDFGDSPLEAAVENHNQAAVNFLSKHGAKQVHGTPERRQAASHAIVQKAIQRQALLNSTRPNSTRP